WWRHCRSASPASSGGSRRRRRRSASTTATSSPSSGSTTPPSTGSRPTGSSAPVRSGPSRRLSMSESTAFADGFHLPECPRWHDGRLWMSDMWGNTVYRFDPDGTRHAAHRFGADEDPGGLGWLPDGRLLVVGMEGRRLYRM